MPPSAPITADNSGDYDRDFYHRVVRAKGYTELYECRKFATRSQDERVIRAFVAAMFTSKTHQREISKCIREYIGRRAVPALLWNLKRLAPAQAMFQTKLLCKLGHADAFPLFFEAMQRAAPLDPNAKKGVAEFMANYAHALLPRLRDALTSNDDSFVVFCSPYLHKYHPTEVTKRLSGVLRTADGKSDDRNRALQILAALAPEVAAKCLLDEGVGYAMLVEEIDAADAPEKLYRPCIELLRYYREDSLEVVDRVLTAAPPRLRDRLEQLAGQLWPGQSLKDLLDSRRPAEPPPVPAHVKEPGNVSPDDTHQSSAPPARARKDRTVSTYDRNRTIADEAKQWEGFACQTCGRKLVNARTGEPYAESHHVHPLGHEGEDSIDNLLCLCPLCHSLFHLGCVGIDSDLRIRATGAAVTERLLSHVRMANTRTVSRDALRYHWVTLFIPPDGVLFDEREADD